MPTRRSASIRLVAATLLVMPITLLGACGGPGGDDNEDADSSADSEAGSNDEIASSEPDVESADADPLSAEVLSGEWVKVDDGDPACANYPDQLTFESFGYLASLHDDREVVLDGGSWDVDGDRLILSNPIDAMVSFPARLNDDELELETGTCVVRYKRLGEPGSN